MSASQELYVGIMSGTSLDAVDAVLVDLAGPRPRLRATRSQRFPASLRDELAALTRPGPDEINRLGRLDAQLGTLYADCVERLLQHGRVPATEVRAVGCHGQTVRHAPGETEPFTLQIGDPNRIAQRTGITTVADFRRRDLAVGGDGAPLAPAFHLATFRSADENRVVLNIGGIANITVLPRDTQRPVLGFDTGPGNALLDAWVFERRGERFDRDGAWAAAGTVHDELLRVFLSDPYFETAPPKSTGKERFDLHWIHDRLACVAPPPRPEDVQATLSQLTANTVAGAIARHAQGDGHVLVCGGGADNADLMRRLEDRLAPRPLSRTAALGLDGRWVEAVAFAWLAKRTLAGLPGNLPAVTGAHQAVILGGIYLAPERLPWSLSDRERGAAAARGRRIGVIDDKLRGH